MTEARADTVKRSVANIFRNTSKLLSGKAIGGVLSLGYLAIASRALGPEGLGVLVLVHSYVMVIANITRFQSWQAIIRFGSPMITEGNERGFKTLTRFTTKLDLLSAIAAIALALILVEPVSNLMKWPADIKGIVYLYCVTTPFLIIATPTGLLRLFDKFGTLRWQSTLMPGSRFIGAVIVWAVGGGLTGFLIVWIVSALLQGCSLWFLGWRELMKRKLAPSLRKSAGDARSKEWLPFMIKTNLTDTIELSKSNLLILIVGAILGSAASGFLQLAMNLANLMRSQANMFNYAIFPELSKVQAASPRRDMINVARRSILVGLAFAAPAAAVYLIFGETIAALVGGPEFAPAGLLIGLMALAQLTRIASVVLESAILAIGRAGFVLSVQFFSACANIAVLLLCLQPIGLITVPAALATAWLISIAAYSYALLAGKQTSVQ